MEVVASGLPIQSGMRSTTIILITTAIFGVTLYGCQGERQLPPPVARLGRAAPPQPAVPHRGTVTASWYGPGLSGHRTASGEVFRPNRMTAASKTLPLGSLVNVTNPANGKSVVVVINDRGPYVRGRGIDLSQAAARRIGLIHKGVGRVKITVLRRSSSSRHHAKRPPATTASAN